MTKLNWAIGPDCLRLRSFFVQTDWVCHLWCNLNLVTRVGLSYFFGTLKDCSLKINSLALNNCFSYRSVFQNGVNALSKMVLKKKLVKKLKTLCSLDHTILFKFPLHAVHTFSSFFELFLKKWLTNFDKALTPFWKMFLWLKLFFDSKLLM